MVPFVFLSNIFCCLDFLHINIDIGNELIPILANLILRNYGVDTGATSPRTNHPCKWTIANTKMCCPVVKLSSKSGFKIRIRILKKINLE